jgi:hypothetical protein
VESRDSLASQQFVAFCVCDCPATAEPTEAKRLDGYFIAAFETFRHVHRPPMCWSPISRDEQYGAHGTCEMAVYLHAELILCIPVIHQTAKMLYTWFW